jgi:signal transduction histidine kinase
VTAAGADRPVVLVVDDEEIALYRKAHILRRADFEVIEARSGPEALVAVAAHRPRVVVLDVNLPGLDGWEVCRRLKADAATASTLVLQVSATYVSEEDRAKALEGGADACLTEPIEPPVLIATVRALLRARRAEDALRDALDREAAARAAAEAANRTKDEFLATLSHELRNPLAPLRNALEILSLPGADPALAEQARQTMERQLKHMVRLVDDLLDLSRISRGVVTLRKERVELASAVHAALETSAPLIRQRGHDLVVQLPEEPVYLHADPTRLAQVFANLLHNAAKYTEPRGHLRLTGERVDDEVVVRVWDTGIGIPADALGRVFEIFAQVEHAGTRAQGGLGVGLSLVRGLVELHGGTVEAHSDGPGRGSVFTVRLPALAGALPEADGAPAAEPEPSRAGCRVLIVDDNRDSADSLCTMLTLKGHEARVAYDGASALAAAEAMCPDAILLDIGLPGMDGYEVARRLLERPWRSEAVVVAVTGWGHVEDRERARLSGFDHHMTKPLDPQALDRILAGRAPRPSTSAGA